MYNPKHSTPRRPGRPLSSRKALFALVSVLVLVFAAVGVTVAYLQTQTEPLENQIHAGEGVLRCRRNVRR